MEREEAINKLKNLVGKNLHDLAIKFDVTVVAKNKKLIKVGLAMYAKGI